MSEFSLAQRIRYPALADLMGSGFHQDFWDFHESPEEVVSTFTGDPIFCARIPLEVEELLGELDGPDREQRLDEVLRRLHNGYAYEARGRSARVPRDGRGPRPLGRPRRAIRGPGGAAGQLGGGGAAGGCGHRL